MDPRLLRYYNQELQHVRETGAEFASAYPKIAGRLGMDGMECADPYVERLLEGFAFLSARVQMKMDAQHPVFTQHLLRMLYPQYLAPVPSMTVVEMSPDSGETLPGEGHLVSRGTALRSQIGFGERTACEYRTAHPVNLLPLSLDEARYLSSPAAIAAAGLGVPPGISPRAALRLRFKLAAGVQLDALSFDELPVFFAGAGDLASLLYEQVLGNGMGFSVVAGDAVRHTGQVSIEPRGFTDAEALLPVSDRSFSGYRLLQEYFACPQRFQFAAFTGLRLLLPRSSATTFDIVVWLDRAVARLEKAVDASYLRLFCTPAINLFPRRSDRIHLRDGAAEYHVLADRTRPMDFEVYDVEDVQGFGDSQEPEQSFFPFYGGNARTWHQPASAFYTLRREPRVASQRQRRDGPRSSYVGGEVFLSLVDGREAPYPSSLRQLGMRLLCSNRDLPLHMPVGKGSTDLMLDTDAPVRSIRCVAGPTRPRAAMAEGQAAWKLVSHLQLNYLSLLEHDDGAAALREMLLLYSDEYDASSRRLIEGLREVRSAPIVRRLPIAGPVTYGRGLEIRLTCEDQAFEGSGAFLFGSVMQNFFARYVSLNSFTETVLHTLERNEVARWTARSGTRPIL
ncbi:type VI secretion system protein ImpG [Luteibacter rhizovicinus DSM 16549]|uniref:Type VI secretion system protein ImpG n=1 Tax=Luteibacter rhizovicinus DSM 16549 TaxID=1440763 RepID=A0A0G9HC03_9GAMM|nr:type VI secretion system baseplate subunit TssF [Luteibacter rhizovicinus]APG05586.1 type VI secretion system protein ImpG [Luteibacter rhizovicinus DSM 16549]KLD67021.1 type VI secretion system protein ImpG [Luteibacter rhizovicinus DSM 16549]KLD78315.1 type VI secretion system protein ImpG [Xanthomonas hyacinthi DSM 19077]